MRGALTAVEGIIDIQTNVADHTCTFSAPADLDVDAMLDKIIEGGTKQVEGWSLNNDDDTPKKSTEPGSSSFPLDGGSDALIVPVQT